MTFHVQEFDIFVVYTTLLMSETYAFLMAQHGVNCISALHKFTLEASFKL